MEKLHIPNTEDNITKDCFNYLINTIDNPPTYIFYTSQEGQIIDCNNNFAKHLQFQKEELLGKNIWEIDKSFSAETWNLYLQHILETKEYIYTGAYKFKDSSIHPIETKVNLFDFTGKKELLFTSKDVRKDTSDRKDLKIFTTIVENSPEEIILLNTKGKILFVNDTSCIKLGFSKQELHGEEIKIITPDLNEKKWETILDILKSRSLHIEESYFKTSKGKAYPVEIHMRLIEINKKLMISCYTKDISERKKAMNRDRLKSSFLARMSHDIRTPMNSIVGFSELIVDETIPMEEKKNYISYIYKNSNQLLALINDIIDISKIEVGEIIIRNHPTNINNIMSELETMYKNSPSLKNNDDIKMLFEKNLNDSEALIISDTVRLKQVLINLINNAIRHTTRGYIKVSYIKQDENNIAFSVKDTGIGIPKEKQKMIFDEFKQAADPNSISNGGTGLGLAISKNIVKLLDGNIWVESTPGKGSSFFFTIPYKRDIATPIPANEITSDIERNTKWVNKNILIVDDEKDVFIIIENMLKETGVYCIYASSGYNATKICQNNSNIDVILLDIQMPKVNGIKTLEEIRSINPNIPVIANTAYALTEDKEKYLNKGFNNYISKPISKAVLLKILGEYL